MNDIIYWVWLAEKNSVGSSDAIKLLEHFEGGAKEIYEASREELMACKDCNPVFLSKLFNHDLTVAENILEFCFDNGIRVIPCSSPNYPTRLHDLYNKPVLLYVRGEIEDLNERFCVSIVGTRNMSSYGKHVTFMLARQLIGYGAIIISGAAYGIDSAANNTAVFFEEPTIAVLGSGINVPYPQKNKEMLDRIASNGMVISEYPPNTPPNGWNFPKRNRIISGLAHAVVIVEAGEKSGALITARVACDQGRRVYAVPGNIGAPNSVGTNKMIRDGAKLVTCAEDIIEDFTDKFPLEKIDRIIKNDKYVRYEYNHSISALYENRPLHPKEQDKIAALKIPKAKKTLKADALPDVPSPKDYRRADKRTDTDVFANQVSAVQDVDEKAISVQKEEILNSLSETERRVYEAIPHKIAVNADKIARIGIPTQEVMSALTMLELHSLIEALPGGLYRKLI